MKPRGLVQGSSLYFLSYDISNVLMVDKNYQVRGVKVALQIAVAALIDAIVSVYMVVVGAAVVTISGRGEFYQFSPFLANKKVETLAFLQVGSFDPPPDIVDAVDGFDGEMGEAGKDSMGAGVFHGVSFDKNALKHGGRRFFQNGSNQIF